MIDNTGRSFEERLSPHAKTAPSSLDASTVGKTQQQQTAIRDAFGVCDWDAVRLRVDEREPRGVSRGADEDMAISCRTDACVTPGTASAATR